MTTQLQLRRGTTTENNNFKGAEGELTYDTQLKQLRIHDNINYGGTLIDKSSNLVHLRGSETIENVKTFTGVPVFAGGVSSNEGGEISFAPTNNNSNNHTGYIDVLGTSTNERIRLRLGTNEGLAVYNDGKAKCTAPTASSSTSDTWIATIGWVNDYQKSTKVVHREGTETIAGDKSFTGTCSFTQTVTAPTFSGTATRAEWADLAENYKSDKKYPAGTLIKFDGEQDITIAKDGICNGVISDKPGFLLDSELKNSLPLALVGKTKVRVIGKVNKFDNLVLSSIDGVARVKNKDDDDKKIIAKALEATKTDDEVESLIMCVVKFNIF